MIMFSNNRTSQWAVSDERRAELFKLAREKGPVFRKSFQDRRLILLEERAKIVRQKQALAAKKLIKDRKEKEKLTSQVALIGLWQDIHQVEAGLDKLKSRSAKLKGLKTQLDFRKKVLQQTHPNKIIFQSSHLGKQFTVEEMKEHLNQLLGCSEMTIPEDLTGKRIQHR